jgi:hypothetical protein
MHEKRAFQDAVASAMVAAALVLPLALPLLDDATHVKVHVSAGGGEPPRVLTLKTSKSVCATAAAVLSYDDPADGSYTKISCDD